MWEEKMANFQIMYGLGLDKCFQVVGKRLVSSDKEQPADDLVIRNLVQFPISVKMVSPSHSIS